MIVSGHGATLKKSLSMVASILAVLLLGAFRVEAQGVYYVRASATGANNGSDWTNAYKTLPATLQRGATYYVASGSYPSYTFNTPESGTALVTIKKASGSDHGTDTGWQSSYGSGQAQFGPFTVSRGYLVIDGAVGGGPGSWKTGHGFKIAANYSRLLYFPNAVSNITVSRTEFAFPTSEVGDDQATDHIYGIYGVKNFTLEYCYLHDTSRVFILSQNWEDILVQYCYFARNRSTSNKHAEAWSDRNGKRIIVRFNIWEDIEGTGVFVLLGLTGGSTGYDYEFYGNVIFWTGNPTYYGVGNGSITTRTTNAYAYNWKVYNNTIAFHGKTGTGGTSAIKIYNGSGNIIRNNLYYDNPKFGNPSSNGSVDYNFYIKSGATTIGPNDVSDPNGPDPFVSSSNRDFRLKAATQTGANVTASGKLFHLDPYGVARGADGVWDRGAFEYTSGTIVSPPSSKQPLQPSGYRIKIN
jgi:hypothetical protein